MEAIRMADVGDGLCMKLDTISGSEIYIDCGSQQGGGLALGGLNRIYSYIHGRYRRYFFNAIEKRSFILSHFHTDHYNGIINAAYHEKNFPRISLNEIYFPLIPDFGLRKEFMTMLFCMAQIVYGNETGIMPVDLIESIKRVNDIDFTARALSKGDTLPMNGLQIEVLWPPKILPENKKEKIQLEIGKAIDEFEKLKESNPKIQETYDKIKNGEYFKPYLNSDITPYKTSSNDKKKGRVPKKQEEIPDEIKKFNDYLRNVANYFSLSFVIDNRFLFLGDLDESEIGQVIGDLNNHGRRNFHVLVTPHHGTHWNGNLNYTDSVYALSSVGPKLVALMEPGFKNISEFNLATHVNGDIHLPFRFYLNHYFNRYFI